MGAGLIDIACRSAAISLNDPLIRLVERATGPLRRATRPALWVRPARTI